MNGETGKIVRLGALLCGAAIAVSACANPFKPPPADKTSPVAAETDRAARHGKLPRFADIPAVPTDVRSPTEYKTAVTGQEQVAAELRRQTAPNTFELNNTDAFAARARSKAKAPPPVDTTEADRAATDAFVKAARARASAPSSPR
ncbi:MAG: hypothetical protein JWP92_3368 [Caulobacter sp.]|nr:hypothetical protein [Caulobacter sp.]